MGDYNPRAPYILGNEWVPIRDASYQPDQISEHGYTFQLEHTSTPVSGGFYVHTPTPKVITNVAELINVYPRGTEDQSGPIRRVVIPTNFVSVTGSAFGDAASVANPSDGDFLHFSASSAPIASFNFPVQDYSQQLFGKRILGVRLVYTAGAQSENDPTKFQVGFGMVTNLLSLRTIWQPFIEASVGTGATIGLVFVTDLKRVDFSDTNIFVTNPMTSTLLGDYDPSQLALPWRYEELLLFSLATTPGLRRAMYINADGTLEGGVDFGYVALEVFYCEETRVRYGGRVANGFAPPNLVSSFPLGPNFVHLRDTSFAVPGTLPRGDYVITHAHRELKPAFIARDAPRLHAVRQLYELPSHQGVVLDTRVVEDSQFTSGLTDEITTITLHTSSAIVTGVHPYIEQIDAPTYGAVTATQRVRNPISDSSASVRQARYYARRFGDTTVPLVLNGPGASAIITPAAFDALPNIVDGWREVTLDLTSAVTVTGGAAQDWTWSAAGETAGNQWQVLGARSFAVTGTYDPRSATYLAPNTDTALTWKSPNVTGSTLDPWADATIILSTDPPAVTGFAISTTSIPTTGVGQFCGSDPSCIPTAIQGLSLTWSYLTLCDEFDRTSVSTWNAPSVGPVWQTIAGAASSFNVSEGHGRITHSAAGTGPRTLTTAVNLADFDVLVEDITWPVVPTSSVPGAGNPVHQFRGRHVDASNYVEAQLFRTDVNSVTMRLVQRLAGVETSAPGAFTPIPYAVATSHISMRFRAVGTLLQFRAWITGQSEPTTWMSMTTGVTSAAPFSLIEEVGATSTNLYPLTSTYGSFKIGNPALFSTHFEVQRRDQLTDWQKIMLSSGPCIGSFVDIEARVGQLNEYRIRTLNALDFAGPWVSGSGMIPAPGVQVSGDANSVLIFTSNAAPLSSLAYVMEWEGQPVETFVFPEASTVQLQRMFGKDFFTAFHPLERGGEQFTRVLLVNAAAITLPSLANFRSLRDLSWADLDYVCVRDELGNRWFANVRVPDSTVRRDRTIYLAQVQVTEVTDTPSPIDPGSSS